MFIDEKNKVVFNWNSGILIDEKLREIALSFAGSFFLM
jgi:hypothetical protein